MQDFTILAQMEKLGLQRKAICQKGNVTGTISQKDNICILYSSKRNETKVFRDNNAFDFLINKFKEKGFIISTYSIQK